MERLRQNHRSSLLRYLGTKKTSYKREKKLRKRKAGKTRFYVKTRRIKGKERPEEEKIRNFTNTTSTEEQQIKYKRNP